MSTTMPMGMRAPSDRGRPSAEWMTATGELMPSLDAWVGTLTKSAVFSAAAILATSTKRPPPTPTTTPGRTASIACVTAWTDASLLPAATNSSTSRPIRRPSPMNRAP